VAVSFHAKRTLFRRLRRPRLPEALAAAVLILAVAATAWWLRDVNQPEWQQTMGTVRGFVRQSTHYNAPDYQEKVYVTYEYSAETIQHTGKWEGFWPETESPNALPAERLAELAETGNPLVVFFDPRDPARSRLHGGASDRSLALALLAFGTFALALAYCGVIYPKWVRA